MDHSASSASILAYDNTDQFLTYAIILKTFPQSVSMLDVKCLFEVNKVACC